MTQFEFPKSLIFLHPEILTQGFCRHQILAVTGLTKKLGLSFYLVDPELDSKSGAVMIGRGHGNSRSQTETE